MLYLVVGVELPGQRSPLRTPVPGYFGARVSRGFISVSRESLFATRAIEIDAPLRERGCYSRPGYGVTVSNRRNEASAGKIANGRPRRAAPRAGRKLTEPESRGTRAITPRGSSSSNREGSGGNCAKGRFRVRSRASSLVAIFRSRASPASP